MDIRSKIIFSTLALLVVISVAASYYKYVTLRDFTVVDDTEEELEA